MKTSNRHLSQRETVISNSENQNNSESTIEQTFTFSSNTIQLGLTFTTLPDDKVKLGIVIEDEIDL